jgi:hypothetical protein
MKTKPLSSKENNTMLYEIRFSSKEVKLTETIYGTKPIIEDGSPDGGPGEPAIPARIIRIALPVNCCYLGMQVKTEKPVLVSKKSFIAPIQPAQVAAKSPTLKFESLKDQLKKIPRIKKIREKYSEKTISQLKRPEFIEKRITLETRHFIPDIKAYTDILKKPSALVSFVREENYGLQRVVVLKLKPLEWRQDLSLWLYESISVSLRYEFINQEKSALPTDTKKTRKKKQPQLNDETIQSIASRFSSANQVRRIQDLVSSVVINPSHVIDLSNLWPRFYGPADYLIITDNNRWDTQSITTTSMVTGNMVDEFQRLADWKRLKGMTARVVTVSQIVEGRFGNFRTGSRDLQEVIRKFMKWAYNNWGVSWLLLGGDIEIVPAREIAGNTCGEFEAVTDTKPASGKMKRESGYVKMNVGGWNIMSATDSLINHDTGALIRFDPTGTASTGWYFTTNDNYNVRSTAPTNFIRVNGPAATVNARLRWIRYENRIPTDLYYANLTAEVPGGHDWDRNNNGLYGQAVNATDIDAVSYTADISVGRAPVDNATDAATFVNKVLAYEQLRDPISKVPNDTTWLRKFLYLSSNWGGRIGIWRKPNTAALGNNQYEYMNSINRTVIQLENPLNNNEWSLMSFMPGNMVTEVPYNPDAASTNATGWYFANNSNFTTASEFRFSIPFLGILFRFPIPTRWVVVKSSPGIMQPDYFIFDNYELDGSAADQEQLRGQVTADFSHYNMMDRLYEDLEDLTPAQTAAAPVHRLTETDLVNRINVGQHFISMSGHGYWGGCCGFSPTIGQNSTNGYKTFIGYADSCLTNEFNQTDAISETLIKNSNGGAVAYIGNTRYSWIGVGDNFQRKFFNRLKTTKHLGLALDVKSTMLNENTGFWSDYNNWTIFSLNLAGDPEMVVWKSEPTLLRVMHPLFIGQAARTITIRVSDSNNGAPVNEAIVSIVINNRIIRQDKTNTSGSVTLSTTGTDGNSFEIVVVKTDYRPAFSEVQYLPMIRNLDNVIIKNFSRVKNKEGMLDIDQNDPVTGKTVSETIMVTTDMLKDKSLVKTLNKYKLEKTPLSIGVNEETHMLTDINLS